MNNNLENRLVEFEIPEILLGMIKNLGIDFDKTINPTNTFIGYGIALGENRAKTAILSAVKSGLCSNQIKGAKDVLLAISSGEVEITIDEITEINDHIQKETGHCSSIIVSIYEDLKLGDSIVINVLATVVEQP